ncbi:MAG: phage tail protein [Bacteroidales bacterium]|jgi:phage tail-like protein
MAAYYPPVGFHFRIEFKVNGVTDNDAKFQEVTGLTAEIATETLAEGGENRYTHKLPVKANYGNLILKRGMLTNSGLISWFKDAIENFSFEPAEVIVTLLNENHEPLVAWSFVNAWPVKWMVSDLKAQDNSVVIETIELAYNYFRRL